MPMQEMDKKLKAFMDSIITDAIEESGVITRELHGRQGEMISQAEKQAAEEARQYIKHAVNEIRAREGRRINTRMTENKRKLLQYREDRATEAFDRVREKIMSFTASEEYLPHLKKLLRRAVDALGYGYPAEVYLRPGDMRFSDELMADAFGVSLAFKEGTFTLGGLTLVSQAKGRRVDMSFDTAINDMVGHFSELTGINMGE